MRVVSFGHLQNPILRRGLLGNWIYGARGLKGGAWWDGDMLAVIESILRGWQVRLVLEIWVGNGCGGKGISGANRGAACRLGGQSSRRTMRGCSPPERSGSRSQRFKKNSQADSLRRLARRQPRVGWVGVGVEGALVVGPNGAGGLLPEDRFARRGGGLGVVVGQQLGVPRRVRGSGGCARPRETRLVEVSARVPDAGAEAERFVMDFWIREVRGAGAGVHRIGGAGADRADRGRVGRSWPTHLGQLLPPLPPAMGNLSC